MPAPAIHPRVQLFAILLLAPLLLALTWALLPRRTDPGRSDPQEPSENPARAADRTALPPETPAAPPDPLAIIADSPLFSQLVASLRPLDDSAMNDRFAELLASPKSSQLDALYDAISSEIRELDLESARTGVSDPSSADRRRQLQLRMLVGIEFARKSALVAPEELSKSLFEATNSVFAYSRSDDDELMRLASSLIIQSILRDGLEDEARWAATPADQIIEDRSPDAAARHWRRGLLVIAMESAAINGSEDEFNALAARYLALPVGGSEEQRASYAGFQQREVERFRRLLRNR